MAHFVAEALGEPTLYGEHRCRRVDDQVSVERHAFTTMAEHRWLAAGVERTLADPFTVRELVILSLRARERSAAGPATHASSVMRFCSEISDLNRIR